LCRAHLNHRVIRLSCLSPKRTTSNRLHPDDPPVSPLGGVARIFTNYNAYERAFDIANSPNFGACLCVGTWGEGGKGMGKDPVEAALSFGARKKLFNIHFRNVSEPLPKFRETFVDNGYMDMYKVMKACARSTSRHHHPRPRPRGRRVPATTTPIPSATKALRDHVNASVMCGARFLRAALLARLPGDCVYQYNFPAICRMRVRCPGDGRTSPTPRD
jgi:hypothetical protein